jgi:hypothetical protein
MGGPAAGTMRFCGMAPTSKSISIRVISGPLRKRSIRRSKVARKVHGVRGEEREVPGAKQDLAAVRERASQTAITSRRWSRVSSRDRGDQRISLSV